MTGSRRVVQSRSKDDVLERLFGFIESKTCSDVQVPAEEDALDDVFNHVESFVCRGEDAVPTEGSDNQPMMLQRDNSLIEACNSVSSKFKLRSPRVPSLQPVGEKGDALDVLFDNAESYMCGENATGELDVGAGKPRGTGAVTSSASSIVEDEADGQIQLYYRPERSD